MKPDTLVTCGLCGQINIYSRAFKAHQRSKHCAESRISLSPRPAVASSIQVTPEAHPAREVAPDPFARFGGQLAARPPEGALVVADDEDALLGAQFEMQWDRVVGGQRDQLLFGAMMMKLRERLTPRAESKHEGSGRYARGEGVKHWLKTYAPKVSESTAYRLMEIAEGLQAICKLGKKIDLEELLATSIEDLPEKLARQREKIEQLIEGKSQRQLLLEFGGREDRRAHNPGGFRPNALALRAWLLKEYPEHPEWADLDVFSELPPEVQTRFKKEGDRYLERLSAKERAEVEREAEAHDWLQRAPRFIAAGMDRALEDYATKQQLEALAALLGDYKAQINRKLTSRAAAGGRKQLTSGE